MPPRHDRNRRARLQRLGHDPAFQCPGPLATLGAIGASLSVHYAVGGHFPLRSLPSPDHRPKRRSTAGALHRALTSRHEPTIVVAGIVINGDRTYREIEARLHQIAEIHIPASDRIGFIFHAIDVFRGTGYFKDHDIWPRCRRFPILRDLAKLPKLLGIPIVFGHINKEAYRREIEPTLALQKTEKDRLHAADVAEHMAAFATAEIAIERQVRTYPRDEICMLVAEDTDRVKKAVKNAHALLRDADRLAGSGFEHMPGLPLKKIVDTPHFASKAESAPLQLADVCAYLILRRLMRRDDLQEFFEEIAPQLTWNATDFAESMGCERVGHGATW